MVHPNMYDNSNTLIINTLEKTLKIVPQIFGNTEYYSYIYYVNERQ
jgi:hypothetical protein